MLQFTPLIAMAAIACWHHAKLRFDQNDYRPAAPHGCGPVQGGLNTPRGSSCTVFDPFAHAATSSSQVQ